jgi:GNAT superfamily N-acetyltransferase
MSGATRGPGSAGGGGAARGGIPPSGGGPGRPPGAGAFRGRCVAFAPADVEHVRGLAELFEACHCACHCRYWHFTGDKNAWLARTSLEPGVNRREFFGAVAARSDQARGVVAFDEASEVVGWVKLAPAASLPKLYDQRFYRGLPSLQGPREGVLTVGCVLVHPAARRKGVARAMAAALPQVARAQGARSVEAMPYVAEGDQSDEMLWTGPYGALLEAGFKVAEGSFPYPILRLDLRET